MASYQQVTLILAAIMAAILVFGFCMHRLDQRVAREDHKRERKTAALLDLLRHSRPNSADEALAIQALESMPRVDWWDLNDRYGIDRPQVRDAYLRKLREAL